MKKVAVILSGCGVFDGSEIHEATLTLLALKLRGADITIAAPDMRQVRVVDHVTQQDVVGDVRNCVVEAARVARGQIRPTGELRAADFDAAILPGGYGAALNLSNFATAGADLQVEQTTANFLKEMISSGKPVAALCIAPPILARVMKDLGRSAVKLTIGNDTNVAAAIEALGQRHVECPATDCVLDEQNKVVTTPAYMLARDIAELWQGVQKTVDALLNLAQNA